MDGDYRYQCIRIRRIVHDRTDPSENFRGINLKIKRERIERLYNRATSFVVSLFDRITDSKRRISPSQAAISHGALDIAWIVHFIHFFLFPLYAFSQEWIKNRSFDLKYIVSQSFFLFIFDRFDKIRIIWFPKNKLIDKRKYLIYVSSYRIFDIFSQKEKKRKSFSNPRVENPWPKPCLQSQIETIQGYGEWRVNKIIGSQVAVTEARNSLPRDCRWDLTWKIQKWTYSPSNGTPRVSYISWLHFLCESDFKDVTNHVEKFLGTWIGLFRLEMD